MIQREWVTVGVDPAPSKATVVCVQGNHFEIVKAVRLPGYVADLVHSYERLVVAWDAPLSFDAAYSHSDRVVDKATRDWTRAHVNAGRLVPKAVSVLHFAGCPHWAITCSALGMPFQAPNTKLQHPLKLAATPEDGSQLLIEVHPAVTLARWWVAREREQALPVYKVRNKKARAAAIELIRRGLRDEVAIPDAAAVDDDHLDAWVAWKMAEDFTHGAARWEGSPQAGGYVVPPLAAPPS